MDRGNLETPRKLPRRVAVLGAGTMGSQIAGLLAGLGIPCDLLDRYAGEDGNLLVEQAKKMLLKGKPPPLFSEESLSLIRSGNFSEHLDRLREVDWVIEAVVENLEIKRKLWSQVSSFLRSDVVASTNTSGIPIASIATTLPEEIRPRFLGTHFFNPPRYLRLLELVPWTGTDSVVVERIAQFAERVLGKGVVVAHDVPNFIGNRIGAYSFMVVLRAMEEFGLSPDEVDSVVGPAMGRPNSATFRTLDLIGLDVHAAICENTQEYVHEPAEKEAFEVPGYFREMIKRGWTGEKSGQGFYKRVQKDSSTEIHVIQTDSLKYRRRRHLQVASLAAALEKDDPAERLEVLMNANDVVGHFMWRTLSRVLVYAAQKVGEISDDISGIDRAMKWGFGWEMGPFETWDSLGVNRVVMRMELDGITAPDWVKVLAKDRRTFYRLENGQPHQAMPLGGYASVPESLTDYAGSR